MIRNTLIGLAAAAALTAAAASSANAGVKVYFGGPGFGWGPYYGGYYQPYYGGYYGCQKIFVGWTKYWNGWKWKKKKVFKTACY
jgi:hypothetical protein